MATNVMGRRGFLRLSAVAAAGSLVAACGGGGGGTGSGGGSSSNLGGTSSARWTIGKYDVAYNKGLSFSGTLKEAPELAALVKAGKLPKVQDRLPKHPYVVPHKWVNEGKYGGTIQTACSDSTGGQLESTMYESMYGHSPLRWLHDGEAIGPGLAESWSANADLSTWTFKFREGTKWSDGQPFTVDDILYWWNDVIMYQPFGNVPPQELRSSSGTPVTMSKVDNYTLQLKYDAPTPLCADYTAMWVNRAAGPDWVQPKHYMSKYNLKYNPTLNKNTWVTNYNNVEPWYSNPNNPTLTGWYVTEFKAAQSVTLKRNPYYYAIDRWGNQLPYIDSIVNTNIDNFETMLLDIQQGKVDYVFGYHVGLSLANVSTISTNKQLTIDFWDSGSGTGPVLFFNYDHQDTNLRNLFRNKSFRQAVSLATDRSQIRKVLFFNQGELTSGTMSGKAVEFNVGQGPQMFKQWRDAFIGPDATKAGQLLDAIGCKVSGQWRTFPDGSPLQIQLNYAANDASDYYPQFAQLVSQQLQKIQLNATANPVTPTSYGAQWAAGQLQSNANWEVGDGPNCLTYANWLVPMDNSRWAPLEGTWFLAQGTAQANAQSNVDPWHRTPPSLQPTAGGPVAQLQALYRKAPAIKDFMQRNQMVWQIFKIHINEGPFFQGSVGNYPQLVVYKNGMRNIPTRNDLYLHGFTNPWTMAEPAIYDPETYFWEDPSQHS